VSFDIWGTGRNGLQNENNKFTSKEECLYKKSKPHPFVKQRFTNDCKTRKRRHILSQNSQTNPMDPAWSSLTPPDLTFTQTNRNTDGQTPVIGAEREACYTGIKAGIAASPTNDVPNWHQGDALSPTTTTGIIHS
jgi:hypothetical protein